MAGEVLVGQTLAVRCTFVLKLGDVAQYDHHVDSGRCLLHQAQ